jgi:hypothetical protein
MHTGHRRPLNIIRRVPAVEGCHRHYRESLLVLFFLIVGIVFVSVRQIAVFAVLGLLILFVFVLVGNEVQVDGMRLRNLQLRFALGTTENLAFLDLVLVDIDFGGTFRAADHDFILRSGYRGVVYKDATATLQRIIYREL